MYFAKTRPISKPIFKIKKGPLVNLRGRKSTLSGPHIPVPTFPLSTGNCPQKFRARAYEMLRPRVQMAIENVGSFQCLMYKSQNQIWPWKKLKPLNFSISGAQVALDFLAYFDPCFTFWTFNLLTSTSRTRNPTLPCSSFSITTFSDWSYHLTESGCFKIQRRMQSLPHRLFWIVEPLGSTTHGHVLSAWGDSKLGKLHVDTGEWAVSVGIGKLCDRPLIWWELSSTGSNSIDIRPLSMMLIRVGLSDYY